MSTDDSTKSPSGQISRDIRVRIRIFPTPEIWIGETPSSSG